MDHQAQTKVPHMRGGGGGGGRVEHGGSNSRHDADQHSRKHSDGDGISITIGDMHTVLIRAEHKCPNCGHTMTNG